MNARFLEAAREDLRRAARYYEAQRAGLGKEFREEVRAAVERIQAMPEAWHPLSETIRRCRTKRFPFGVIYQQHEEQILVIAVAHLHQKPGGWADRI